MCSACHGIIPGRTVHEVHDSFDALHVTEIRIRSDTGPPENVWFERLDFLTNEFNESRHPKVEGNVRTKGQHGFSGFPDHLRLADIEYANLNPIEQAEILDRGLPFPLTADQANIGKAAE